MALIPPKELLDEIEATQQSMAELAATISTPEVLDPVEVEMFHTIFHTIKGRCDYHTSRLKGDTKGLIKDA